MQPDTLLQPVQAQPIAAGERYQSLDIVRGFALLGVLLVNDLTFFRVSLFQHILTFHTDAGWLNHGVDFLLAGGCEFKAFTLFSFLFGVGVGVQTERISSRQVDSRRFLTRRFIVLLLFGLCHMIFISNVDILCLYAVCGLLMLPLLRLSPVALGLWGLVAIALNFLLPLVPALARWLPSESAMHAQGALATRIYSSGGWLDLLILRAHETGQFILPLLLFVVPKTLGLMLWGVATWRMGVWQQPLRHRELLLCIALGGGLLGSTMTVLQVGGEAAGYPLLTELPAPVIEACSYLPLALAYASVVLLWLSYHAAGTFLKMVAALGQMALTNYLVQSVVLGFIFYGYGLGLMGRLDSATALLVGLAIYTVQLILSRTWLQHFQFGPCEWLWRSLSYGRWQPWRLQEPVLQRVSTEGAM